MTKSEDNLEVKLAAIANLGQLRGTPQESEALAVLLSLASVGDGEIRAQVARVLNSFDEPRAKAALLDLRDDSELSSCWSHLQSPIEDLGS